MMLTVCTLLVNLVHKFLLPETHLVILKAVYFESTFQITTWCNFITVNSWVICASGNKSYQNKGSDFNFLIAALQIPWFSEPRIFLCLCGACGGMDDVLNPEKLKHKKDQKN